MEPTDKSRSTRPALPVPSTRGEQCRSVRACPAFPERSRGEPSEGPVLPVLAGQARELAEGLSRDSPKRLPWGLSRGEPRGT
jgi:hypothetical protein